MPTDLALFYGFSPLLEHLVHQDTAFPLPVAHEAQSRRFPLVQLFEDEAALHLYACIPGATPGTLHLDLMPRKLVIRGSLPVPHGTRLRMERPTGPFRRALSLPCTVMAASAHATVRDGVLTVTLPKGTSAGERHTIPVTRAKEATL